MDFFGTLWVLTPLKRTLKFASKFFLPGIRGWLR
jgi:hypothetical protein